MATANEDRSRKSLKDRARNRILVDMIRQSRPQSGGAGSYMVLVLDKRATRIVSSCVRMYDIMEEGLALVDKLELRRQPMSELAVIYLMDPSVTSVDHVMKDFSNTENPQYAEVHLFFTSSADDEVINYIKTNPFLVSRIRTLVELNLDFLSLGRNMFSMDLEGSFTNFFSVSGANSRRMRFSVVDKLKSVCATLHEYPYVRYIARDTIGAEQKALPRHIAETFQDEMDRFVRKDGNFWFHGQDGTQERAQLLIVDRAVDVIAPLLHEFTYQALVNDVLHLEDGEKYVYSHESGGESKTTTKTVLLNENDKLWVEFRDIHIALVIKKLSAYLAEYGETNAGKLLAKKGGAQDLATMAAAVKELPEFQEKRSRHAAHMHIAQDCMSAVRDRNLRNLALLEQILSTGVDENGGSVNRRDMKRETQEMLESQNLLPSDKLRLMALFIVTQGMSVDERRELMSSGHFTADAQKVLTSLNGLGTSTDRGAISHHPNSRQMLAENRRVAEASEFPTFRYEPALKSIVAACAAHTLDRGQFPFVTPPGAGQLQPETSGGGAAARGVKSARKHHAKWSKQKKGSEEAKGADTAGRVIVFVAGGCTNNEIRAMNELMKNSKTDIILGTTQVLGPQSYLDGLASLEEGRPMHLNLDVADVDDVDVVLAL